MPSRGLAEGPSPRPFPCPGRTLFTLGRLLVSVVRVFRVKNPVKMGIFYLPVLGECFSPRFVGLLAFKVPEKFDTLSGARIAPCRIYEALLLGPARFSQGGILADRAVLTGALRAFLLN